MTFLERLRETFAQLAEVIPAMLGALVILFAGYLLAKLVEQGTERLLHRIRLNQALERGGVMEAVERGGAHFNPTRVIGKTLFWILMFGVIMVAATALGMESLASVFTELVGYLPSLMSAIVIMIAGIVLGRFTGGLIMASAGAVQGAPTLARVGRLGVIMLSVFMALQELGIATDIVTTAFAILFGAVAFGLALAFGLGNRELAGEITREWYRRYRAESEAIERTVAERELEEEHELAQRDRAEAPEMIPAGDTGEMATRGPTAS
ncbi:MAG: hypothetical protein HUU26_10715 [Gemmatimonadaceae bacterium]|nr:hypothetical protein [Gemmatimonadaceae bacterium]